MTYRDDLTALAARHDALSAEVQHKSRELDETARMLAEAQRRASLPILDNIRVASPCKASWDDMVGDDRVRHCKGCDKNVYNLSSLTREEAHALIAKREDELCGRYYRRADGTILTADCSVGKRRRRTLRVIGASALSLVAAAAFGSLAHSEVPDPEGNAHDDVDGEIAHAHPIEMGKISNIEYIDNPQPAPDRDFQLPNNPTRAGAPIRHDVPR